MVPESPSAGSEPAPGRVAALPDRTYDALEAWAADAGVATAALRPPEREGPFRVQHRLAGRSAALLILLAAAGCGGPPRIDVPETSAAAPGSVPLDDRAATDRDAPLLPPRPVAEMGEEERRLHLDSFDHVWQTVRDKHWDPELGGVDWDALRAELRPQVERARTADEARGVLNRLLGALGQSHFEVFSPEVYAEIEGEETSGDPAEGAAGSAGGSDSAGSSGASGASGEAAHAPAPRNRDGDGEIGFDIAVIRDAAVVSRIVPRSPATRVGVRLGWILAAVDGRPVARTIERFRRSDGSGGELELMLRYSILERLRGDPGEEVDLLFVDGRGNEVPAKLTLDPPRGERFHFGHMPPMTVEWELERDGEVAYFRLGAFFDPARVMPPLREFIADNLDAAGFIIDLRGNPGGIGFMANGICGHFVDEPGKSLGTMYLRDGELMFGIFPQATTYTGPLAVLIDGGSASTSEIFAGGLRDLGRARLFGTRTAGAALPSTFERLPSGDGFQYAIANYVSTGGAVLEGSGVAPDVEVPLDRGTLLKGRDPVVEAARRWIAEQG